ncbi:MAG: hypothetical protein KAS32_15955 [Candidatus Peribacteraceae bacterium]|nr:hypothetical protein [Candidatus Peribacteraceae bacterium]
MLNKYIKNPKELAVDVKNMVLSGDVNPIVVKIMFDIFSDAMKDAEVKSAIMSEADLHGVDIEVNGFRYAKKSRTTYSYKHDAIWQQFEAQKKAREELMKLASKQDVADPNTGEIIPEAIKSTSEFLQRAR